MTKRRKARKPAVPAKFNVGDKVRVKQGVEDEEYPDMPLGGWAGTVTEIDDDGMYTVRWSRETLDSIHPVYKKRCERDGLEFGEYWLPEDDLEPDPGGPLVIEHPTQITTRPLSPKDQDDRIRMVFGLSSDDPLPHVGDETLRAYYKHLSENTKFPFEVEHFERIGPFENNRQTVTVLGLLDPAKRPCDQTEGLVCKARLGGQTIEMPLGDFEVDEDQPGLQMLADYCYWFWNSEADEQDVENMPPISQSPTKDRRYSISSNPPSVPGASLILLVKCGLLGMFYGVVVGAASRAIDGAEWGLGIGGGTLGVLGAILGVRYGFFFGILNRIKFARLFGGVLGAVTGALVGAFFGAITTAWMGSIPGAILGALAVRFRRQGNVQPPRTLLGVMAGAGIGTGVLAFYRDYSLAADGTIYGGAIGAAVGVVIFLALILSLDLLLGARNR